MNILGVNGMKFSAKRFESALEDSQADGAIELLLEEGEAYRVVKLEYNGGPKYPALKSIEGEVDRFREICLPVTSESN